MAAGVGTAPPGDSLARQERRFALALLAPALAVLLVTTTVPLVYLAWTSLNRIDLSMPWLSGFVGAANFGKMGEDPRFWNSLWLTLVYTGATVEGSSVFDDDAHGPWPLKPGRYSVYLLQDDGYDKLAGGVFSLRG